MKVFLSHSVKGDPTSEAIARKLFAALEGANFEPFLDLERLEIGEDWEATLRREIEQSDAAVLLLSKKAVEKSEWVAREIHLLQVREGRGPSFIVLPLLLGDAQTTDVRAGRLGHLDLAKRQILRVEDEPRWIEHVLERLDGARGGVLDTYLAAVQAQCDRLPYASLAETHSLPQISEIYVRQFVEVQGDAATRQAGDGDSRPRAARITLDVDQLLDQKEHVFLEGGPGTGKSTLLYHIASTVSLSWKGGARPAYVPVVVTARSFVRRKGSFSTSLQVEVEESLGRLLRQPLPSGFFDRPPTWQTRWLVLIDALDEILAGRELRTLVADLLHMAARPEAPYRFVLTTRPNNLDSTFGKQGFRVHHMLPFSAAQVDDFARKWFAARPQDIGTFLERLAASGLRDLVTQPLLLTIAALVYDQSTAALRSRVALYREFIATVLDREQQVRNTRAAIREQWERAGGQAGAESADRLFDARHELLHRLACYVRREGGTEPLAAEALRFSGTNGWVPSGADTEGALVRMEDFLGRTGLIAGIGDRQSFVHPTFADFLIAAELDAESPGNDDRVDDYLKRWDEESRRDVVLFLLGIRSERNVVVDRWMKKIFKSGPAGVRFCGLAIGDGVAVAPEFEQKIIERLFKQAREVGDLFQRPTAMNALGRMGGRESVRTRLLDLARGGAMFETSRDRTADALAQLGCVDDLRDLSSDTAVNAKVRVRAAAHLGTHDSQAAYPTLAALALDGRVDDYVRIEAVNSLARIGFTREAAGLAVSMCLDPAFSENVYLRVRVAEALGKVGRRDEALEMLFRAVHDPEAMAQYGCEELVSAICEMGETSRLLELREETVSPRRIATTAVRWLYQHGEDEVGARIIAEILREPRRPEERSFSLWEIFPYSNDDSSLARIVRDASIDERLRNAAKSHLERIGYREDGSYARVASPRWVARFPKLLVRLLRWGVRQLGAVIARFAMRARFALCGALGPVVRTFGEERYIAHFSTIAGDRRASEGQRMKSLDRIIELDMNQAEGQLRVMAADRDISDFNRAYCAYRLFLLEPEGEDWQLIADGTATKWSAEYYFKSLQQHAGARAQVVSRAVASTNGDVQFQACAIRALSAWPDAVLAEALARNPSVKPWQRVLALRQIPETRVDVLSSVAGAEGLDSWVRIEAVDRLGRSGRTGELVSLAEESAVDDRIRRYAIWWLGRLADRALEQRLQVIAKSEPRAPLLAAIEDAVVMTAMRTTADAGSVT